MNYKLKVFLLCFLCKILFYNAVIAIKESKKRVDTKAIWQYLSNKLASNIDEDYTGEILKTL